jgi:itaconyl-CoA hydratase
VPEDVKGPPEFDAARFTLVPKGHAFEDFTVGDTFVHHWGRTITAGDNAFFCTATCAWNPMYLNAEFAKGHGHPDVVVNPMLVLCTVVGLSVEDLSEAGGPFLGIEDCTFHQAVYPGETVRSSSTVIATRTSASRPESGIVSWRSEGHNQRSELVVSFERTNLVNLRGAS